MTAMESPGMPAFSSKADYPESMWRAYLAQPDTLREEQKKHRRANARGNLFQGNAMTCLSDYAHAFTTVRPFSFILCGAVSAIFTSL